jgi:hypothetical protein
MAAAVDLARSAGAAAGVAWTLLNDEPRRNFLQSAGWGPDSAYRDVSVGAGPDGTDITLREVRLVTDLTEADPGHE